MTTATATTAKTVATTVTLAAFKLPAFTFNVTIEGKALSVKVAAGVQIPAGVTGTFALPAAKVVFDIDSNAPSVDTSTTVDETAI